MPGLPAIPFISAIYWVESVLCLVVPSSSGLAVLSMPILAPVADFAGVSRELVVTAFQSASGLPNLVTPTSGVVMGGLAIGRVSYLSWLKFIGPLLAILMISIMILLSIGVVLIKLVFRMLAFAQAAKRYAEADVCMIALRRKYLKIIM